MRRKTVDLCQEAREHTCGLYFQGRTCKFFARSFRGFVWEDDWGHCCSPVHAKKRWGHYLLRFFFFSSGLRNHADHSYFSDFFSQNAMLLVTTRQVWAEVRLPVSNLCLFFHFFFFKEKSWKSSVTTVPRFADSKKNKWTVVKPQWHGVAKNNVQIVSEKWRRDKEERFWQNGFGDRLGGQLAWWNGNNSANKRGFH